MQLQEKMISLKSRVLARIKENDMVCKFKKEEIEKTVEQQANII